MTATKLLRSVASVDDDRSLSTPLTRYYAEEGTLRGRKSSSFLICGFMRFLAYAEKCSNVW